MADSRDGQTITAESLATLSEGLQAAINEGHIVATYGTVEVTDKASPTGKGSKNEYVRLDAQDASGMALLCDGKMKPATPKPSEGDDKRTDAEKAIGAADYFNYGRDLDVRSGIRQKMMSALEGPEKAVKKFVAALFAADYTKEQVKETILNSPKYKGVDGIESMIESAFKAAA